MAKKRMFSMQITDSDAFLDMPLSTQCLYFHLNMRADDDGFIDNPKRIMRMIGASEDDLKILFAKNFVIGFETGVIVIKHWRLHNTLRSDRYEPTAYTTEKSMLELKENKAYTLGLPNGCQMVATDKVSIDKNSIDKDSIDNNIPAVAEPEPKKTKHKFGEYSHVLLTDEEYDKLANDYGVDIRNKAIAFLDEYIEEKGYKSKSHNLAIRRWVIDAVKKNNKNNGKRDFFAELESL